MIDERHTERPTKLHSHNVLADYPAFILRQIFQPLAHRFPPGFRPKENSGQWSGHCMTVSFLIHLTSGICTAKTGYRKGRRGLTISRRDSDRMTAKHSGLMKRGPDLV